MIVRAVCLLFLLGFSKVSIGQTTQYKLPIYFGQFFNDPFLNHKNILTEGKGHASIGHRRNSDNFGSVSTSFAAFQLKLGDKEEKSFNEVGLHFYNDSEGEQLVRNRGYLNYSRHIQLNENYQFAGGLTFGFFNYTIKPDIGLEGQTKTTLDGSIFLKLYNEKTTYQFIVNQIYNSSVQPIQEKTVLIRNLNFFWNRDFNINDQIVTRNNLIARWSRKTIAYNSGFFLALNSQLIFQKMVLVGITVEPKKGNYYSLGMDKIPGLESDFGFEISYLYPYPGNSSVNINQFEITLDYKF